MEKRIITTDVTEEDFSLEGNLRPQTLDDYIGQEKAKKKREKMGISENQISNAARMNTRQVTASSKSSVNGCDKAWRCHMSGGRDNSGYIS